jgi:hypothetical protein
MINQDATQNKTANQTLQQPTKLQTRGLAPRPSAALHLQLCAATSVVSCAMEISGPEHFGQIDSFVPYVTMGSHTFVGSRRPPMPVSKTTTSHSCSRKYSEALKGAGEQRQQSYTPQARLGTTTGPTTVTPAPKHTPCLAAPRFGLASPTCTVHRQPHPSSATASTCQCEGHFEKVGLEPLLVAGLQHAVSGADHVGLRDQVAVDNDAFPVKKRTCKCTGGDKQRRPWRGGGCESCACGVVRPAAS